MNAAALLHHLRQNILICNFGDFVQVCVGPTEVATFPGRFAVNRAAAYQRRLLSALHGVIAELVKKGDE